MKFIDLQKQQEFILDRVNDRINSVLQNGQYIMGPEVFELESQLCDYVGVKYCISCSSGTDALLIALMSKNIGIGDAVITTPFTYIATAEVIRILGATPIFIDIDKYTFNIDPYLIDDAVNFANSLGLNPRAIIPVDIFGLPANYSLINKFAKKNNLFVIEDAAQSFGSDIRGKKAGSLGQISTTSFFPAKPLGCYGDGGAIFTNDKELKDKLISIRIHGSGPNKYDSVRLGINGRLDTIQAAILLEKLRIFDDELYKRNQIANYYLENLSPKYNTQKIPSGYRSVWAQFSLFVDDNIQRDYIINTLSENKIPSMIYYSIPLHLQKAFIDLDYSKGDFTNSEKLSDCIFSIPMHPYLDRKIQDKIINILNEI